MTAAAYTKSNFKLADRLRNLADNYETIQAADMLGVTWRADLYVTCNMRDAFRAISGKPWPYESEVLRPRQTSEIAHFKS